MSNSKKKCRYCGQFKSVESGIVVPLGFFCSSEERNRYGIENSLKLAEAAKNDVRVRRREVVKNLRPRSWYLKEAQRWFNKYIRLRDEAEPCISCGRHHQGQYHAGHYRTVGACPELRFEALNCHKQCAPCNNHLSGNLVLYRGALLKKIGEENLLWLEGFHPAKKYSIVELKEIIERYKGECKELMLRRNLSCALSARTESL